MSDRKRGGGLDYEPKAFPGARKPDGPPPDLDDQLRARGLVAHIKDEDDVPAASNGLASHAQGQKPASPRKSSSLDYTAQAFPGARNPDGPEPDLDDQLRARGLVYREEPKRAAAGAHPPPASSPRERRTRTDPTLEAPSRTSHPASTGFYKPGPAWTEDSPPLPPPAQRVAPPPAAAAPAESFSRPRPVPPEPVPGPAPSIFGQGTRAAVPAAAPKPTRAPAQRKKPEAAEKRLRRSIRLHASVVDKLNDLAHLRGLDLNTAIGVAIVQDWLGCFGPNGRRPVS